MEETVQSVCASSYSDIETIIVNDGSTDEETVKVLAKIALEHPDVKVITTENQGVCQARNTGIEAACGEYHYTC